jgi:hypothetical protein
MEDNRINWPAIPLEHLRDHILGDDDLEKAGRAAIEKGDEPCRELLENLDCNLFEQIKVDCGDDPQAMVEELLHRVQPLWIHDELDE